MHLVGFTTEVILRYTASERQKSVINPHKLWDDWNSDLFIYALFNYTVSSWQSTAPNGIITIEWDWKEAEGSSHVLIINILQCFPGGPETKRK